MQTWIYFRQQYRHMAVSRQSIKERIWETCVLLILFGTGGGGGATLCAEWDDNIKIDLI
jgi:hypothetical protein